MLSYMENARLPWRFYTRMDRFRRQLGQSLDVFGFGPRETPSRVVFARPCATLKCYEPTEENSAKPVVLIVPAPIKRAYLWDLRPRASVVRRFLAGGFRVYLLQWEAPGEAQRDFGLSEYADRLIHAGLEAIRTETGQPTVWLAGHSLGGTLAALCCALHPERVRGLILLGAPLHFGPEVSQFGPAVAAAPPAQALTAGLDNVPGSVLNQIGFSAAPGTYGLSRWLDGLNSLADPETMLTHVLAERWSLDEMPLPRRLFAEIVELLYREDRFVRGTLTIDGKPANPRHISVPVLSVVDRRCRIVPPEAVLPFHDLIRGPRTVLWYEGDIGVAIQHLGILIGQNAHRVLWPEIIRWMRSHTAPVL